MPTVTDTREMLLALEPRPESARLARRALHAHGLNEDIEHTVTLLATEIVGNAVRHADCDPTSGSSSSRASTTTSLASRWPTPASGFDPDTSRPTATA